MDKKSYVAELLANGETNAGELSRSVRIKFGKGLNLMDARKLVDAHEAGRLSRVWNEIFATEQDENESALGLNRKKSRGERRRKLNLKGRRGIDRDKIVLREFAPHLVVYRSTEGVLHSQAFESRKRAEALVRELLELGLEVSHYRRSDAELALAA